MTKTRSWYPDADKNGTRYPVFLFARARISATENVRTRVACVAPDQNRDQREQIVIEHYRRRFSWCEEMQNYARMAQKGGKMEQIEEYYKQGLGLKRIAGLTGKSATSVKRYLLRRGLYQGTAREIVRPETRIDPIDLGQWQRKNVECVQAPDGQGWIVTFHAPDAELYCPLSAQYLGKQVRLSLSVNPQRQFDTVVLGFQRESQRQHVIVPLMRNFLPSACHMDVECFNDTAVYLQAGYPGTGTFEIEKVSLAVLGPARVAPEVPLPRAPEKNFGDLGTWECCLGATCQPTEDGWEIGFLDEKSSLICRLPWQATGVTFEARALLLKPWTASLDAILEDGENGQTPKTIDLQQGKPVAFTCKRLHSTNPTVKITGGPGSRILLSHICIASIGGEFFEFSMKKPIITTEE